MTCLGETYWELQTHYFHLGSICRISRAENERTVIFFDNGSFIMIEMDEKTNHDFISHWGESAIINKKYKFGGTSNVS